MANMGRYCKAYPIARLSEFSGWSVKSENLRKDKRETNGKQEEVQRTLGEDDFFYIQENFVVTDGIYIDQNIVFDNVTPEWIDFCTNHLEFKVPVYESAPSKQSAEQKEKAQMASADHSVEIFGKEG